MGTAAPAREATIQAAGLDRQCHLFPLSGEDFLTPNRFFWDISLTGVLSETLQVEGHVACHEWRMTGKQGIFEQFRNSAQRRRRVVEVEFEGGGWFISEEARYSNVAGLTQRRGERWSLKFGLPFASDELTRTGLSRTPPYACIMRN